MEVNVAYLGLMIRCRAVAELVRDLCNGSGGIFFVTWKK